MQILTQRFTLHSRGGNVSSDPVHCKHQEREDNALPELRDIEYILQAGEQELNHLNLAASGLDFLYRALAELVGANR